MNKSNIEEIREFVRDVLFENTAQISLRVDGGMYKTNSRNSMFDTPGPQKTESDAVSEEEAEEEVEYVIPLTADDVVNNQSTMIIDFDTSDKSFVPSCKPELSSAIAYKFNQMGNNELSKKRIEKIWRTFNKLLEES